MLAYPYPDLADSRRRDYERRAEHHRVVHRLTSERGRRVG